VLCRTKLTFTVDPEAKLVATCPAPFSVCALLDIAAWLKVNGLVVPTVSVAVAALLLVSIALTVTLPDRPAGTVT
jgi:hypothetical protein